MKKEEFPTFLNEQPVVAFGRTTRELILILLGIALAYLVWALLGRIIPGDDFAARIVKGIFAILPLAGCVTIAFVQLASRPLEMWGIIGMIYFFTPKVFAFDPAEDIDQDDDPLDIEQFKPTGKSEANSDW